MCYFLKINLDALHELQLNNPEEWFIALERLLEEGCEIAVRALFGHRIGQPYNGLPGWEQILEAGSTGILKEVEEPWESVPDYGWQMAIRWYNGFGGRYCDLQALNSLFTGKIMDQMMSALGYDTGGLETWFVVIGILPPEDPKQLQLFKQTD